MKSVEKIHRDHTRRSEPDGQRVQVPADDCQACGYQRSICRSKQKFESYDVAHEHTVQKNISTGWGLMLCPYQCSWCLGWHITRARKNYHGKSRWRRVEKERRRWLTLEEVKRRERREG